jgi:hypothetical protein
MSLSVAQTACLTTTVSSIASIALVFSASTAVSTVSAVALSVFAVISGAVSIASLKSWLDTSVSVDEYWDKMGNNCMLMISGMFALIAQASINAAVQGSFQGVFNNFRRRFG